MHVTLSDGVQWYDPEEEARRYYCWGGDTEVFLAKGRTKRLADVQVGDMVRTAKGGLGWAVLSRVVVSCSSAVLCCAVLYCAVLQTAKVFERNCAMLKLSFVKKQISC